MEICHNHVMMQSIWIIAVNLIRDCFSRVLAGQNMVIMWTATFLPSTSIIPDGLTIGVNANWIGYVAVSNDNYSAYLGRRDITIAWRGTMTDVEKIANLMFYQNPIRDYKIPILGRTIKAEAGLLKMYAKKDEDGKLCNHTEREQVLAAVKRVKDQ